MKYNVKQDPLCSTLMSSIKGAYEFYHNEGIDNDLLFGISGHIFMVNITKGIGPCAPYLWDMNQFLTQVKKYLGVEVQFEENGITQGTSEETRKEATKEIKKILDEGNLVFLTSLEYQLIIGYENDEFITTIPWENVGSVTNYLSFDTLEGIKEFMSYSNILPSEIGDLKEGIKKSIEFGISLYERPPVTPDFSMGIKALDFWLEQMTEENVNGHGNWWSSTVWSESRKIGSEYMLRLKEYFDCDELLEKLSKAFVQSSDLFMQIADKESTLKKKTQHIKELKKNELNIYEMLKKIPL